MKREVKVTNGGSLTLLWPDLTVEQMYEVNDFCVERFGVPLVTDDRGPVDLTPYIERRMGEVGEPRREITIEPVPEEQPEPVKVPEREPERVPV